MSGFLCNFSPLSLSLSPSLSLSLPLSLSLSGLFQYYKETDGLELNQEAT